MWDSLINGLSSAGDAVLSLLPTCPFISINEIMLDNAVMSAIAWFIPFNEMIALLTAWLAAITVWYVAKTALRWAKIIS